MRRFLRSVLLLFLFSIISINAQSTVNYAFSTGTNGNLTQDMNGNPIDMSTGTTTLVAAGVDDTPSPVTNIGFDFWLMGVKYSQFSCNENGNIKLGGTAIQGGSPYILPNSTNPILTPFGNDMRVGMDGVVVSKVIGTAPNRVLVVQFTNIMIRYLSTAAAGTGTFQARIYEGTGIIEYVYGAMTTNTASPTTYTVGFSVNTTANNIISVKTTNDSVSTSATVITNTYTASSTITELNSTVEGSRKYYRFTPSATAAPSTLTFTGVTASSMMLNWVDNSTNEVGFVIYRSTDGTNYSFYSQTAAGIVTATATNLLPAQTYYWKVYSVTEGALSLTSADASQATLSGTLSGTKTIGPSGNYVSLTAAITDIKTNALNGPIILELMADYISSVETFPVVFSGLTSTAINTITVRPQNGATNLSISSNHASATIVDSTGANYLIIDGRAGGTGTSKDLTIENTNTSGTALRFKDDASYATIRYCTIKGVATSTSNGVVVFGTSTGTTGNSNNLITNCDLGDGATLPANIIYSSGTAGAPNSNNTISNCNIYNFYNATNDFSGVYVSSGSTDWTIMGNSFYETATRNSTGSSVNFAPIRVVNSSGNNFYITGNYIGGTAPLAGGTPLTLTGGIVLRGIMVTAGTTVPSSIQGNNIQNISVTTTSTSSAQSPISLVTGAINCGTSSGNIIGSQSSTGNITFTGSGSGAIFTGILAGTGTAGVINIANNQIGGISVAGSGTTSLRGIGFQGSSGTFTVSNNIIGSLTTANSMTNATNSSTIGVFGGASLTSAVQTISNNVINNLSATGTSTSNTLTGILAQGSSGGKYATTGNTVSNLTSSSASTSTGGSSSIIGISHIASSTADQLLSQNIIYNLNNTTGSAAVFVTGIHFSGPSTGTNVVSRNLIHSLNLASTSNTAATVGINIGGGVSRFQNNMIRLGVDASGNPVTSGYIISGIDKSTTANNNIYFNTIYIGGTGVTATANSFAFRRTSTGVDTLYNNIFFNNRSNGAGTGKHYSMGLNAATTLVANYNIYYGTGTGYLVGLIGTTDYETLSSWKGGVSGDANSTFGNPQVINPNGDLANLNLHISTALNTPVEASGIDITSITDDFDGDVRANNTPVDIGADAGNFVPVDLQSPVIIYTHLTNTTSTANRTLDEVVITDPSGVNVTTGTKPRIYFKRLTDANTYNDNTSATDGWKWIETSGSASPFSFTIDYSMLYGGTGVAANGYVQYFIVAQDLAPANNVSIQSGSFTATPSSVALTAAAFPITGTIQQYKIVDQPIPAGTYTVGVSAFNKAAGKNLYKVKVLREHTVLVPVTVNNKNRKQPDLISTELNTGNMVEKKVTEEVSVLYENGAPYKGGKFVETGAMGVNNVMGVFPTLTDAIAALSERGISGAVTFSLIDTLYTEAAYPLIINRVAGVSAANTITFMPAAGVTAKITGAAASAPILSIRSDYVTINGSNSIGGATRDLTIMNTSTTSPNVLVVGNADSNAVTYVTVKNCNIINGSISSSALIVSDGTTPGNAGKLNNIVIQNNSVQKAYIGVYCNGVIGSSSNVSILGNDLTSSGSNAIGKVGLYMQGVNTGSISNNIIGNFDGATGEDDKGIWIASGSSNITVNSNIVKSIKYTGTGGYGAHGIAVSTGLENSNIVVSNNLIYDLSGDGYDYTGTYLMDNVMGITAYSTQTGVKIYNNSINLFGNTLNSSSALSMGIMIGTGTGAEVINNSVVNNLGLSTSTGLGATAVYLQSWMPQLFISDNNVLYCNPTGSGVKLTGKIGTSLNFPTLAEFKTATTSNMFSYSGAPGYTSNTDLMPDTTSVNSWLLNGNGMPLALVTADFNGTPRNTTVAQGPTDIGAFEFTPGQSVNPPAATADSIPAPGRTQTFSYAGRNIAKVTWGSEGTVPSSLDIFYRSGVTPPAGNVKAVTFGKDYWTATATDGSGYSYGVTFNYTPSSLGSLDESQLALIKRNGTEWNATNSVVNTTEKSITALGLTSFSDFALAQGSGTGVPVLLQPANNSVNQPVSVNLTWSKVSAKKGVVNYHLQVSADSLFNIFTVNDSTISDTTKLVGPLTEATKYFWRVKTNELGVPSAFSGVWKFTTELKAPDSLMAMATQIKRVYLLWRDNSQAENGYTVERKLGDTTSSNSYEEIMTLPAGTVTYMDTLVLDTTRYSYRVRANNPVVNSAYSNQSSVMTMVPVELTTFTATASDNSILIAWETATEQNNKGFEVQRKLENEDWTALQFVNGKGTTTEKSSYQVVDKFQFKSYKGAISYRLKQVDFSGFSVYSATVDVNVDFTPKSYSLSQNYPNPFNPATTIQYALPFESNVKINIYSITGELVEQLVNSVQPVGYYNAVWNASRLSSGVYFYTIEAKSVAGKDHFNSVKKMILIK